ncbi:hypothetical protein ACOSP7_012949 [Xanthoceras sorbifolium]
MHNSKNTRADRKDGNFNRMSAEAFKPKGMIWMMFLKLTETSLIISRKQCLLTLLTLRLGARPIWIIKKKDKVVGEDSQLYMKSSLDTVKKTFPSSCSSGIESKIRKAKSKGKKKIDSSREEAADTMLEDVGVLQQLHLDIQTSMEASQHFN